MDFKNLISISIDVCLPYRLKPYLLYLSAFPEDRELDASNIIKLWIAEGFVEPSGSKSLEEIGEEHLEELVQRNLVTVSKRKSNGKIKSFNIETDWSFNETDWSFNDVIHDMCTSTVSERIREAEAENCPEIDEGSTIHTRTGLQSSREGKKALVKLTLSFNETDWSFNDVIHDMCTSTVSERIREAEAENCPEIDECRLEALINSVYPGKDIEARRGSLKGRFRLLRVLDMSNAYYFFNEYDFHLPEEVFELFHLRYLAFDSEFSIPEAISNLQNLQSLIIRPRIDDGRSIVELPVEIWRAGQLRHLVLHFCVLPCQEEAKFALENLQTLTGAVDFICSIETMKMLPYLKKLGVFYTEWRDPEEDYQLQNLRYFLKLENLKIAKYNFLRKQRRISFAFPPTLVKLNLSGLGLPWEDLRIVGSLPKLQVLKLRDHACIGDTWETTEGYFSQLLFLLIDESDLKHWITQSTHFPRLIRLILHDCKRMREIPKEIGEIPTVELIEVDDWNKLLVNSAKRIQKDRLSLGNYSLDVRVVNKNF